MKEITHKLDELTDSREVFDAKTNSFVSIFISILILLVIIALIWSFFGEIEEVAKASGIVRPNDKVSTIQSPAFGQVENVHFEEGQVVNEGDLLFTIAIDNVETELDYRQEDMVILQQEKKYLERYKESVEAETNLFSESADEEARYYHMVEQYVLQLDLLDGEYDLSASEIIDQKRELDYSLRQLEVKIEEAEENNQIRDEVLSTEEASIKTNIQITEQELANENLFKQSVKSGKNVIPKSDEARIRKFNLYKKKYQQLKEQLDQDLPGEQKESIRIELDTYESEVLHASEQQISHYEQLLQELNHQLIQLALQNNESNVTELQLQKEVIQKQIDTLNTKENEQSTLHDTSTEKFKEDYLLEVAQLMDENERQIQSLTETIEQLNETIEERKVKAPITGKVHVTKNISDRDWVQQGEQILTILPSNQGELKMQIAVPNHEVGKIDLGDKVNYNFNAFPKQNYGQLTGEIISISSDAIVQEDGISYYLVEATLDQTAIEDRDGQLRNIMNGMSSEVSIVTETKKVIHFVLEKINLRD